MLSKGIESTFHNEDFRTRYFLDFQTRYECEAVLLTLSAHQRKKKDEMILK